MALFAWVRLTEWEDHMAQVATFCRACNNACPMIAEIDDGTITSLSGDPNNELWAGYSCIKGRTQHVYMQSDKRLRRSVKRDHSGAHQPISIAVAMDEIAAQLTTIVDRHGPRAVAGYWGSMGAITSNLTVPMYNAFFEALGSPMSFNPDAIDKPGKKTARALHGYWMAPRQAYDDPEVMLLIGLNPYQSYFGVACGHPNRWLSEQLRKGAQLIVIDPRSTDVARRAALHIQPVPGHDTAILAAILQVVIRDGIYDQEFVESHTVGLDALAAQVAEFSPERVAHLADIAVADIETAARAFATAKRGYVVTGVGPHMSEFGTLLEYLMLNLETLCGRYLRAGERVHRVPILLEPQPAKAQAANPTPAFGFGHQLRVHGLGQMAAGMPTGGLADEILLEGEGRVRALLSVGGNPVSAWPDQLKVIEAMNSLDLLVQVDPWMSATARQANYVIAPTMAFEVPAASFMLDLYHIAGYYYGPELPFAHYTEAIIDRPADSDVVEEWEFFYGLAQRMGLQLRLNGYIWSNSPPCDLDMVNKPSTSELIEVMAAKSIIPLEELKTHPHGLVYRETVVVVEEADPGWPGRLDLGNGMMMDDLNALAASLSAALPAQDDLPFRLICRRMQRHFNSTWTGGPTSRGRGYNPAYMHPDDLAELGLVSGDAVELRSARAAIPAVVEPDRTLRRGLVSIAHGFGDSPERDDDFRDIGSAVGRLLDGTDFVDRITGQARMSNIPIAVTALQVGLAASES